MVAASTQSDPHDLQRFLVPQEEMYARALQEIKAGHKRSHWMWFIFPQFKGLGYSAASRYFAIQSLDEARAYLAHATLGPRLRDCVEAALAVEDRTAHDIFGSPDDMKLQSCATLFASVSEAGSVFERLLAKYYDGQRDGKTVELIAVDDR